MTAALARVPLARLVRSPRSWLAVGAWVLVALASALYVRARGKTTGADHVLRGSFGVVFLPLVAYTIVGGALGRMGLRRAISGVVVLGASPRRAALATTLVAIVAGGVACALLAAVVCVLAHGASDPPLGRDLLASSWIGALGGAAYAAYFCAGAAIGRGSMRSGLLAIDWVVGSAAGLGAVLTPRGHVLSLLGGSPVFELPARASSISLGLLVVFWTALAVMLGKRPPR